jgi:ATP-dependent helicase HrpA
MRLGTRRLLLLDVPVAPRGLVAGLDQRSRLALAGGPDPVERTLEDCVAAAVDQLVAEHGGPAWDEDGYRRLRDEVRAGLPPLAAQAARQAAQALGLAHDVRQRVARLDGPGLAAAREDLEVQLDGLVHPGFVRTTGVARLPDLHRYLRAVLRRLEALPGQPKRDAQRLAEVHALEDAFHAARDALPPGRAADEDVEAVRWLLEEFRVSCFAQQVGTPVPVSAKRIRGALAALSA